MDAPPGSSVNVSLAQRGFHALNLAYIEQRRGQDTILSRVFPPVCPLLHVCLPGIWQTHLSIKRQCCCANVQARTIQLLSRCAVQKLCNLSGAVSWEDATRQPAWSAEAQSDLAEGPQHSDQLALTLLQDAGGRRLEADWRQRWVSISTAAAFSCPRLA